MEEGPLRGALFLAMELAEHSLGDRLRRPGRIPTGEVVSLARDLAEALAWLHTRGAVHRDVKPDNVFRADDRWKMGTWGW